MTPDPARFERLERLLGTAALQRLQQTHVVVVGLGAVGSYATEALARAGVGRLRLVDCDEIRASNRNRQLYALESTAGVLKAQVAKARVHDINPACAVEALPLFADPSTLPQILRDQPVVVDAIDSLGPKVGLLSAAHQAGLPCFSAMGMALKRDPTQLRLADIGQTRVCRLARFVRQRLGRQGIRTGITCVYSEEPPDPQARSWTNDGPPALERGRSRQSLGSLPTVTGCAGLILANAVLLAQAEEALSE